MPQMLPFGSFFILEPQIMSTVEPYRLLFRQPASYSENSKLGRKGVQIVERIISDEFGWLFKEQDGQKDFGIDAHIELVEQEGNVIGRMVAVQIKCGDSFFKTTDEDGFVFYGKQKHLNYFLNYPLPVILILCNPKTEFCWWCEIDPVEMDETPSGWKITVPFEQKLDIQAKQVIYDIAGSAIDFLPSMQNYWDINRLMVEGSSAIHVVIAREDIEAGNINLTLTALQRLSATKKLSRKNCGKVMLSVHGYDNDPRELHEIKEVRDFVFRLDQVFPFWFYFLEKHSGSLAFITACMCIVKRIQGWIFEIDETSLAEFINSHFIALNHLCLQLGINIDENKRISEEALSYYQRRFNIGP